MIFLTITPKGIKVPDFLGGVGLQYLSASIIKVAQFILESSRNNISRGPLKVMARSLFSQIYYSKKSYFTLKCILP